MNYSLHSLGKTPETSRHLEQIVFALFFIMMPACAKSHFTQFMTPVICLILMSILRLSEAMEEPFGYDTYDLPWLEVFRSMTSVSA